MSGIGDLEEQEQLGILLHAGEISPWISSRSSSGLCRSTLPPSCLAARWLAICFKSLFGPAHPYRELGS